MKILFTKNKRLEEIRPLKKEYIADMETDGIRFDERISIELKKRRDKLICNYSGLPSIYTYE
jgi:hypothetical protein